MPTDLVHEVRERLLATDQDTGRLDIVLDQIFNEQVLAGNPIQNEPTARQNISQKIHGYGALQPFLDDPDIEEIWINQPNEIRLAKAGEVKVMQADLTAEEIRTLVLRMLRRSGRRVDTSLPFCDAILEDGSRLHVVIPDVTASHWSVNIRKFPSTSFTVANLTSRRAITPNQGRFLTGAIRAGRNILISGATHTGKTTMLVALLNELPADTRLISCEETFELRSDLKDWVPMQARQPNLEGQGEIPLRRLVKESLRMRPDRLVIGEVREAEALDLLVAMNSGVPGACTIHANSAAAAITKLCTLPLLAGPNISSEFVRQTVGQAIDLVIHCERADDGTRRIAEIGEVYLDTDANPAVRILTDEELVA